MVPINDKNTTDEAESALLLVALQAWWGRLLLLNHVITTNKSAYDYASRQKGLAQKKHWTVVRRKQKIALAPAVQKQCAFGLTWQNVITGKLTTSRKPAENR